ncbi:hypothetical protein [uncultured Hymenobacter sp.]|uniref:hypothetical protein n=1 Tax=uncultured Hymenobacter sp. TaxID=170016 RepID=UPI0035CBCE97
MFLHRSILSFLACWLLCLLFVLPVHAQAPTWQSVVAISGELTSVSASVADGNGHVYLAGSFTRTAHFGTTSLTSTQAGSGDVFVAKWHIASRSFVWVQQGVGMGDEEVISLALSGTSLYITGNFSGATVRFGNTLLTNRNATTPGSYDVYVAKLTDAGSTASFTWAQQAGGTSNDLVKGMTVSGTSIYLIGDFRSATADFGPSALTNADPNFDDQFVAKLTDAGNSASFLWAYRAGSSGVDHALGLAVSGPTVYLVGLITRTASFGSITLPNPSNNVSFDMYVAKLTDAGNTASFTWAQRVGGTSDEIAYGVAVNGTSVYVVGLFYGSTVNFGNATLANANGGLGFNPDLFITKLTDNGTSASFVWAQRAGGTSYDVASKIIVKGTSLYVAGTFQSASADFGSSLLINSDNSGNTYDVFVTKLTDRGPSATFVWAQQGAGLGSEYVGNLSESDGNLYLSGEAQPPASFGSFPITSPGSTYVGFVASLPTAIPLATQIAHPMAVELSPNPASTTLHLRGVAIGSHVQLVDVVGRLARITVVAPGGSVSLQGVIPGLYVVRATDTQGHQVSSRLVVE